MLRASSSRANARGVRAALSGGWAVLSDATIPDETSAKFVSAVAVAL